jgi:16S rRNA (cytosine967-C5)-methyltransferase
MPRTETKTKNDARYTALRVLERTRRTGAWSDDALASEIRAAGLDARDASLTRQICYGVLQNMTLCDYYIDCYSSTKSNKLEPKLLDILRMSVYQIAFLERIPAFSVVNEGVSLCKRCGLSRASGLCNAVLRRVAENRDKLPPVPNRGTAQHLATRFSHPLWLAEEMVEWRGYDAAMALFRADNAPIPITAQVNTVKTTAQELMQSLQGRGVDARLHPWMPDCLYLRETGAINELPEFNDGLFYVQDNAARLAVMAAGLEPGMDVLDCCAAPGGKSFAAALIMKNEGSITSCDINAKKLPRIEQGAKRLGIDIISTRALDARHEDESLANRFDVVIADVPCSGMGVIRKKPEIRYKSREDVAALPEIQLDILKNVSKYVKPGGVLMYSTCTVLRDENQRVIERFLAQNSDFEPQKYRLPHPVEKPVNGMISLFPYVYDCDGFFICRLGKKQ